MVIPFGFNLLLDIVFSFIAECQKDSVQQDLRLKIMNQFGKILASIVEQEKVLKHKMDNSIRSVLHRMIGFLTGIAQHDLKEVEAATK